MDILTHARQRLVGLCTEQQVDQGKPIIVRQLSAEAAIGPGASDDFAIKRGKERVIEAVFDGARGQAFTDQPSDWQGTLGGLLGLDLSAIANRALFVAGMNAVLRAYGVAAGTIHCTDDAPERCGPAIAEQIERERGSGRIGLIGLQPAILGALAWRFSPDRVRVIDLDPDNIDTERSGVPVWDGREDLARLVDWCDVGLATGSSIVNGTIDDIAERFRTAGKPVVFFGNTIAGAAALLGLARICPFGQ